jgi:hypothetical protein
LITTKLHTLRKTLADNQEFEKWEDNCWWTGRFFLVKRKFPSEEERFPFQQEFSFWSEGIFLLTSKTLSVHRQLSSYFSDSWLSASVLLSVQYFQFELYMALLYMGHDLLGTIKKSMASLFILEILELFQNYLDFAFQTGFI